jgi:hypothetical protein
MNKIITLCTLLILSLPIFADQLSYQSVDLNGILAVINNPYYEKDGIKYPLASIPDRDGDLCQAFGFTYDAGSKRNFVAKKFKSQKMMIDWDTLELGEADYAVQYVFCGLDKNSPGSTHYSNLISNSDNTFTIVEPRFFIDNKKLFFHAAAAAGFSGVCKIFGFNEAVSVQIALTPENNSFFANEWIYFGSSFYDFKGQLYHQSDIWTGVTYQRMSNVTCKN